MPEWFLIVSGWFLVGLNLSPPPTNPQSSSCIAGHRFFFSWRQKSQLGHRRSQPSPEELQQLQANSRERPPYCARSTSSGQTVWVQEDRKALKKGPWGISWDIQVCECVSQSPMGGKGLKTSKNKPRGLNSVLNHILTGTLPCESGDKLSC